MHIFAHELFHRVGAPHRVGKTKTELEFDELNEKFFGSEVIKPYFAKFSKKDLEIFHDDLDYAREELVAEMASCLFKVA